MTAFPPPRSTAVSSGAQAIRRSRDRRDQETREEGLRRVRAEFERMPGLRLTAAQARRLFGLRQDVSDRLLGELVRDEVLWQDPDGRYRLRPALP